MQYRTSCCKASIERGSRTEYPLGGRTWGINYAVDVCGECGKEVKEIVTVCDCCGEVSEQLIEVKLGSWCKECTLLYAEDLIERVPVNAVKAITA